MVYVSIALRAFRRYSTYRGATLAGIFTNSVFGVIVCFVYLAVWEQRPNAGGYDAYALPFVIPAEARINP